MILLPMTSTTMMTTSSTTTTRTDKTARRTTSPTRLLRPSQSYDCYVPPRKDDAIRSRLLHRLGITSRPMMLQGQRDTVIAKNPTIRSTSSNPEVSAAALSISPTRDFQRKTLIGNVVPFQEPLKGGPVEARDTTNEVTFPRCLSLSSSLFSTSKDKNDDRQQDAAQNRGMASKQNTTGAKSIQFNAKVTVIPIPSRYQYSDRIKRFLWSNSAELREMTKRNIVEFQSEGWNWHSVLEDNDMHVDLDTGELIHPCWVDETIPDDDNEDKEGDYTYFDFQEKHGKNATDDGILEPQEYLEMEEPPKLSRGFSCVLQGLDELNDQAAA